MVRLTFYTLSAIVLLVFTACGNKKNTIEERPNIIFIYSDDQRQDAAGFNGNDVIYTPSLDKLAKQGIRFNNASVVMAFCSPSRAALLTGRYGSANGVLKLGSDLNPDEKTIAHFLKNAGYSTAIAGKWHIGRPPSDCGFDWHVYFESNGDYFNRKTFDMGTELRPEIHCDEYCVNRSIDFLKEAATSDKPFFLFHNTQLPHMNHEHKWPAKEETRAKYNKTDMPVAETRLDDLSNKPEYLKTVRNLTQAKIYGYPEVDAIQSHTLDYYSVISEMDDALGRLLNTVEELGLRENTYIFFMSDNGWMLGEHGFTSKVLPYQASTSVPLFVAGPDIKSGENNNVVLNIDFLPTILELASVKLPENIHGNSILPILKNEETEWRENFIHEGIEGFGGILPHLAVIGTDYRYIETYEDRSLSKVNFVELYNMKNDPVEMNNLAQDSSLQPVVEKHKKRIVKHKKEILNIDN